MLKEKIHGYLGTAAVCGDCNVQWKVFFSLWSVSE